MHPPWRTRNQGAATSRRRSSDPEWGRGRPHPSLQLPGDPVGLIILSMNRIASFTASLCLLSAVLPVRTGEAQSAMGRTSGPPDGWATNGPMVYRLYLGATTATPGPAVSYYPPPLTLPPDLRREMITFMAAAHVITT